MVSIKLILIVILVQGLIVARAHQKPPSTPPISKESPPPRLQQAADENKGDVLSETILQTGATAEPELKFNDDFGNDEKQEFMTITLDKADLAISDGKESELNQESRIIKGSKHPK